MITKLWPFTLGSVAFGLDAYVIAGLLPTIATDLKSTPGTIGMGVAAFTAAYAFSGPVLAGTAGRRAFRSLLIALGVFTLANVASALSTNAQFFIVTRLIAGSAAGIYSPLSSSVSASSVIAAHRGRALSLVLAGLACGTVFGVPLGLVVAERSSWRWTFVLIAILGGIACFGIALRGRKHVPDVESPSLKGRLATMARVPNMVTMVVTLLTGIASLGLYTYFVPTIEGMGYGSEKMWLVWIWGVGGAIGAFSIGRLVDSASRPAVLTALITALLALTFVSFGSGTSLAMTTISVLMWGILGWSSLAPQQHTLLTSNPDDGTPAVAANASANYFGSALGSAIGAALVNHGFEASALPYFAAATSALAFTTQCFRIQMA